MVAGIGWQSLKGIRGKFQPDGNRNRGLVSNGI